MKTKLILLLIVIASLQTFAQPISNFNLDAYKSFLQSTKDMSSEQLLTMHPAGSFRARVPSISKPAYMDSIDNAYSLTTYEKELLAKHGFVVTSRVTNETFMGALKDVFHKDLPVFVSTDAILHAIHKSYNDILMDVERSRMIYWLDSLLAQMHYQLPVLSARYSSNPEMLTMLKDLDVYLTMPRKLLGKTVSPYYGDNNTIINSLQGYINALYPVNVALFSVTVRKIDFSQFKVRGHYTDERYPELAKYFQAMMWLGRTEIYLIAPNEPGVGGGPKETDIQRQTILAFLVAEAIEFSNVKPLLDTLDSTIKFFVGESDNVTVNNILTLKNVFGIQRADTLLDTLRFRAFQDTLKQQSYSFQRINSQILMSNPGSPDQIKPASAFLLLGQRFVIDSYVTGNVVYDKIIYKGSKVLRMLPSTLDVLFALGNDAAAQLLEPELQRYNYSSNLAALRYLVDSYESDFWTSTLYNGWLQMIRTLNPPRERQQLPAFMQTAAWWQEKMNTQLASWAELRHDNLLYAKQSYTGGAICSFPHSYVEPIPEFYSSVKSFASIAAEYFSKMGLTYVHSYFNKMYEIANKLQVIAQKTLNHIALTDEEKYFLMGMIRLPDQVCGAPYTGWYTELYYTGEIGFDAYDALTADVHTAPTDAFGNEVGWVLHAGTGDVEMAIVNAVTPDGQLMAFIGPVYKYHELVTTNFKRMTDEEWKEMYKQSQPPRPPFVNLYLANKSGETMGEALSLQTSVNTPTVDQQPQSFMIAQNFPNPFNAGTIIPINIPLSLSHSVVKVKIYNITGQEIANLLEQELPAGNYAVRWDGTTNTNLSAASGVYFYHITVGSQKGIGKMLLVK